MPLILRVSIKQYAIFTRSKFFCQHISLRLGVRPTNGWQSGPNFNNHWVWGKSFSGQKPCLFWHAHCLNCWKRSLAHRSFLYARSLPLSWALQASPQQLLLAVAQLNDKFASCTLERTWCVNCQSSPRPENCHGKWTVAVHLKCAQEKCHANWRYTDIVMYMPGKIVIYLSGSRMLKVTLPDQNLYNWCHFPLLSLVIVAQSNDASLVILISWWPS